MNQTEFLQRLSEKYTKYLEVARTKNSDYADENDAFKNFKMCEAYGVQAELGILVRMSDKFTRFSNLLKKDPLVVGETITDTLEDLSIYATILSILIESRKK